MSKEPTKAMIEAGVDQYYSTQDCSPWFAVEEIYSAMVKASADAEEELLQCEVCEKSLPIDDLQISGEIWICDPCYAEWKAGFDACEHDWKPADFEGEDGRYCHKCAGWESA